ncbi:MAG TPA: hypothetical protein VFG10_03135 [Saprospiraceae bacterium]|nr:hypothetical protein [Saprospiraceae bacterium]
MNNTNQSEALNSLILSLEERRTQEFKALKDQLKATGESLKPANLIKSAAEELTGNKQLRTYLLQAGIGLAVSLVTKKFLTPPQGNSTSTIAASISKLGLKKLTPRHIALIEMLAPLLIGFVVSAIKRKKKKKAEKNNLENEE